MDHELLGEYDKALSLDADLVPALKGRALARFHLKQFQKAIEDYDKILSLNPQDVGAYEERGLAKMQLGRSYEAISDFSALIKTNTRKLMEYGTYEIRADAYIARALSRVSDGRR